MTINPAKIMRVSDRIGSLVPGKDADLVIWSGDPFDVMSRAEVAYIGRPRGLPLRLRLPVGGVRGPLSVARRWCYCFRSDRSQRPTGPGAMISAVTASSSSVIATMMIVSAASPAISNTNSADGGATVTPLGGGV